MGRDDMKGDIIASSLTLEMRLLHHMIGGILIPKLRRHDFVSEMELMVMYYIVRGMPLNLSGIMMNQIREVAARKKACWPYGMILTRVFEVAGVSLENEYFKKLSHFHLYDDRALNKMNYHVVGGRWIKKILG